MKIDDKIKDDESCGGFKHCKDRKYITGDPICQECSDDYDQAMEEVLDYLNGKE